MKYTLGVIALVILAAVGLFYFFQLGCGRKAATQPQTADMSQEETPIEGTDTAHQPKTTDPIGPTKRIKRHTGIGLTIEDIDGATLGISKGCSIPDSIAGKATVIVVENKKNSMNMTVLYQEDAAIWKPETAGYPQPDTSDAHLLNATSIPIESLNQNKHITISITVEDEDIDGTKKMETSSKIKDFTAGRAIIVVVEDKKGLLSTRTHTINDSIRALIDRKTRSIDW